MTKNCPKCGQDFASHGARVCEGCRKICGKKPPIRGQQLTFRQKQIVTKVREGNLNKQIAFDLHLAEGTVKEQLYHIYRKLGVSNRTELAVWAVRGGL